MAIGVRRPSGTVWTLVRQAAKPGSAQWDRVPEKKLTAIRMNPERIRNVMSDVIDLWRRVESLGGCQLGTFSSSVKKKVQPLSPEECGARYSQVGYRATRSSQKAPLSPGNNLALFMELRAHNYSENIRIPANSKGTSLKYPRRWQGKIKMLSSKN